MKALSLDPETFDRENISAESELYRHDLEEQTSCRCCGANLARSNHAPDCENNEDSDGLTSEGSYDQDL